MAKIAFIGLGNMGGPMAANLVKGQHQVTAFDLTPSAVDAAVEKGARKAATAAEAVKDAEVVVTMLPQGKHVRSVYENDVLPHVAKGAFLIDCSTIDVDTARHVAALAEKAGLAMVDAPVSGGVGGATGGTLTFMVGGSDAAFAKARGGQQLPADRGTGAGLAGQPRLRARLHRREHAEGPQARPAGGAVERRQHADGRRGGAPLQPVRQRRQRRQGLLGHHPHARRQVTP